MNDSVKVPPDILSLIPSGPICRSALELANTELEPAIYNHSLRVYLHALRLLSREKDTLKSQPPVFFRTQSVDRKLLFIAAMFHDMGTTATYNGRQRFEVEGADAAYAHMLSEGPVSETDTHKVWSAIALHTSSGIAERIDPFTRVLRIAVKIDFAQNIRQEFDAVEYASEIEASLPRMQIERVLANAVVAQAGKILNEDVRVDGQTWPDSEKHPKASWPGILLRAHLLNPDFEGVNPAF